MLVLGIILLIMSIALLKEGTADAAKVGVIVLLVPFLVILQGRAMIRLIRNGFRRRGWWVQRA